MNYLLTDNEPSRLIIEMYITMAWCKAWGGGVEVGVEGSHRPSSTGISVWHVSKDRQIHCYNRVYSENTRLIYSTERPWHVTVVLASTLKGESPIVTFSTSLLMVYVFLRKNVTEHYRCHYRRIWEQYVTL